jgi:hypothetical protein
MSSDKPKSIIATLLLERPATVDYRVLAERIGKVLNVDMEMAEKHAPGFPMTLVVEGTLVIGIYIDRPYPVAELNPIAPFMYWWRNVIEDVGRSPCFITVAASWPDCSRLDAHIRHLIVVREFVEQLPVIGVLWGSALVQPDALKGQFQRMVKGEVPFPLWVLTQFSKQPNGNILISTLGMGDFEQMEIETESALPVEQTFDIVRKFGAYILGKGPVVQDGETIGITDKQRITVRHRGSFRPDVTGNVYWLELAEALT